MDRFSAALPTTLIQGELVIQLRFDFGFTVVTEASMLRIETRFALSREGADELIFEPSTPTSADQLLKLHQSTMEARCSADGTLEITFANGIALRVTPDAEYEAWTLSRGDGELFVALPGGGVATFGPEPTSAQTSYKRLRDVLAIDPTVEHGGGASLPEIESAIRSLGPLPDDYLEFLQEFGWLRVAHYDIYGLGSDVPPDLDLVVMAQDERENFGLPVSLAPIMNDGGGNLFCFDTASERFGEVVYFDHETMALQPISGATSSFSDWLLDLID